MARQVLPIVGAVIGGIYGGPAGAQAGYMIGSIIGNVVDPQIIKGPRLGEAGLQTSAEGVFRPILFGTGAVKGNVVCRGNRQVRTHEDDGKGGPVTETERVYWTFAIRICEARDSTGGITLLRMWEDEKLVYDVRPESTIQAESAEFAERFRFYNGSDDQLPDPDLEAFKGVGNVPAYRGSALIVFPNYDLTDTGERIKDYRFEVSSDATVLSVNALIVANMPIGYTTAFPSPDGVDWSAPGYPEGTLPANFDNLIAGPDRLIAYRSSASGQIPYWTIDQGLTWTASICSSVVMRGTGVYLASEDIYYIPCDNGILFSENQGVNFSFISEPGAGAGTFVMSNDVATLYVATSSSAFFALIGDELEASGEIGLAIGSGTAWATDGTTFRYGGAVILGSLPAIRTTTAGSTSSDMAVPAPISATTITAMAFGTVNGVATWVAGTDSGEVYRDIGDGWELMGWTTEGQCNDIGFNGEGFIFLSNGTGANDSRIYFSETGESAEENEDFGGVDARALGMYAGFTSAEYQKVPLSYIVSTLCSRPGLPASRYDVSELTDLVDGLVLADDYTYADAIRTLMPIYFFGVSEHDAGAGYKLHFPMHGKPVVVTLTIDDFVDVPDKTVRQDAFERPRVLHVHYQAPLVGYAPAKASPTRFSPDVKVVGEQSVNVPVSFTDQTEIWQRSDKLLKIIWTGIAGEEEFTLPESFLYLVPTDAVGIVLRGQARRMVFSNQFYEPGYLKSKLVADRQSNYTSTLTGVPLPPPTPPPPSIVGPTIMAFGDWPALNDNNDRLLYYLGATGQTEAWHGAQIDRSIDSGSSFQEAATFSQNTIMGTLMDDITAASPYYTDTTNVIRVHLYLDDEIEALSEAQFNSEGGAFMLSYEESTGTRWEMLQYRDAEQDSNGDWLLSHLKRGQLNTEPAAHEAGSMLVMLDRVKAVDAVTAWLNTDLMHRATSIGKSPDGVPTQTDEYTGTSQREFPVASVTLIRDVDDITVEIIPRHRFGTESNPIRSINWERYTIEISDGVSLSSVGTTSDSYTFDASAMSSPIQVSVAQRNRLTGDGPFVSESIA